MFVRLVNLIKYSLLALVLMVGISGCVDRDGPAEDVGESIDDALERAGERIDEAADEVEDDIEELTDDN